MPNVFNVGNVVKQLIWTRMILDTQFGFPREVRKSNQGSHRLALSICNGIPLLTRQTKVASLAVTAVFIFALLTSPADCWDDLWRARHGRRPNPTSTEP
jgi:hypothetical protein